MYDPKEPRPDWRRKLPSPLYGPDDLAELPGALGTPIAPPAVRRLECAAHEFWHIWRAAEQGDANAQYMLRSMSFFGLGMQQDQTEAVKWARLAAAQGHVRAQYNIGVAYDKGQGAPRDYAEAFDWYRKAAEQDFAEAQYNL